ncbi:MAG: S8 family serine peptidase [Pseudonocardiaceae bacterium]|nr:S8 family serine peptidase [Pseudonocardiaceae bacterium]
MCAVLVTTGTLSGVPAGAAPVMWVPPVSPPVQDSCPATGPALRYVVLFEPGTAASTATDEVTAACGSVTAYYREIAVGVVTSPAPVLLERLGRDRIYSAAAEAGPVDAETGVAAPDTSASRDVDTADRSAEQWDMAMTGAARANAVEPGSRDVTVGVLDSGIDPAHPDLVHALDRSRSAGCLNGAPDRSPQAWMPTASTHGTHVAGTIAAADDGRGITGVAPGVRLASVKVVDDEGFIYPENAVCGFMWAARQGIDITNNSYFVDPWLLTCADQPGQQVAHEAVRRAVAHATGSAVLSVAATGNAGLNLADPVTDRRSPDNVARPAARAVDDECDVLPAELPGVTTVSAVGAKGVRAGYSSYGADVVDVAGPGGDRSQPTGASSSGCVLSTIPGGYGYACGTSMASPHAAGVAALLASRHPGSGPAELAELLASQADPLACPAAGGSTPDAGCDGDAADSFYGQGLVDAMAAVTR